MLLVGLTGNIASGKSEVARLLGTPWDVTGRPVRLQDLGAALAEHGLTVRGLVEALDGRPILDRRRLRTEHRTAQHTERSAALRLFTEAGIDPTTAEEWLAGSSLPRPGDGELRALTEQTLRVWRHLPGPTGAPVRLARLAATVLHDALAEARPR